MTHKRHPSLYKPGFAEDRIPDRFTWVDRAVPPVILALSIAVIVASIWNAWS